MSGYGMIGDAQSNQAFDYQRYISNKGTLKRDTVLGVQADIKFDPQWGQLSRPSSLLLLTRTKAGAKQFHGIS